MTHTSHTPGPWKVVSGQIVAGEHDEIVASRHAWTRLEGPHGPYGVSAEGIDPSEADANARLIAEAPAMLEALKAMVQLAEDLVPSVQTIGNPGTYIYRSARAIIDRIEGTE